MAMSEEITSLQQAAAIMTEMPVGNIREGLDKVTIQKAVADHVGEAFTTFNAIESRLAGVAVAGSRIEGKAETASDLICTAAGSDKERMPALLARALGATTIMSRHGLELTAAVETMGNELSKATRLLRQAAAHIINYHDACNRAHKAAQAGHDAQHDAVSALTEYIAAQQGPSLES
jgi:hypothetical protein